MNKLRTYVNSDYHFDKSTNFAILSGIWAFAGIFGFIYEVIFYYFNSGMEHLYWRGGCFGPWIVIYGIGALLIYFTTYRFKKKPWLVLLLSGLGCGILEFGAGAIIYYTGNGKRNWDYNTEILNFGNIGGFVCLRSVLIFALSGLMLIYLVVPAFYYLAKKMNKKAFKIICDFFGILFLVDVIYNTILVPHIPGLFGAVEFYKGLGFNFMHF